MKPESIIIDLYKPAYQILLDNPEWFNLPLEITQETLDNPSQENIMYVSQALLYPIFEIIDDSTKHKEKLIPFLKYLTDYLNEFGLIAYSEQEIHRYLDDEIEKINDFLDYSEWNIYSFVKNGYTLIISKNDDWRALEYEKLTAPPLDDE